VLPLAMLVWGAGQPFWLSVFRAGAMQRVPPWNPWLHNPMRETTDAKCVVSAGKRKGLPLPMVVWGAVLPFWLSLFESVAMQWVPPGTQGCMTVARDTDARGVVSAGERGFPPFGRETVSLNPSGIQGST